MTESQLKRQAAEKFVREVLGKKKTPEKVIKLVVAKVVRATPTVHRAAPLQKKRA